MESRSGGSGGGPRIQPDLRTPRSTFQAVLRAVLHRQVEPLWRTVHPDLYFFLNRLYLREGAERFFKSLAEQLSTGDAPVRLGEPEQAGSGRLLCPLLDRETQVGVAGFQLHEGGWVLYLLA